MDAVAAPLSHSSRPRDPTLPEVTRYIQRLRALI